MALPIRLDVIFSGVIFSGVILRGGGTLLTARRFWSSRWPRISRRFGSTSGNVAAAHLCGMAAAVRRSSPILGKSSQAKQNR
jgi:hypothetical protein